MYSYDWRLWGATCIAMTFGDQLLKLRDVDGGIKKQLAISSHVA